MTAPTQPHNSIPTLLVFRYRLWDKCIMETNVFEFMVRLALSLFHLWEMWGRKKRVVSSFFGIQTSFQCFRSWPKTVLPIFPMIATGRHWEPQFRKNKAGFTATPVACGWTGAVLEKVIRASGREQWAQEAQKRPKSKKATDQPTDRPINMAGCRVAEYDSCQPDIITNLYTLSYNPLSLILKRPINFHKNQNPFTLFF